MSQPAPKKDLSTWSARNDMIVMMAFSGHYTNGQIGEKFGITAAQVGNIVNDPRAKEVLDIARHRLREKLMEDIEDQLDLTAKASLKVLKRTIKANISPMHKAKINQDRVALKLLQGRGFLSTEARREEEGTKMSDDQFNALVAAIEKSDRAKQIPVLEDLEAEVVEDAAEDTESQ